MACVLLCVLAPPQEQDPITVGMMGRIRGIVLPGPELVARPLKDRHSPIVLRIVRTSPHGAAFRYDLDYYGTVPGSHDLKDYLQRQDGSSMEGVPSVPVAIAPAYPRDDPRRVSPVDVPAVNAFWSYQNTLIALGGLWLAGLAALIFTGRRKRRAEAQVRTGPPSLADLLRPLVLKAADGSLSGDEQARLERLIFEYWRGRERLEGVEMAEGLRRLRHHAEAGLLLRAMERWLHEPGGAAGVDLSELLRPYRSLPADASARGA